MEKRFDTVKEALDYIDGLPKAEQTASRLSVSLIEGVYDKRGLLKEALYEWRVRTTK